MRVSNPLANSYTKNQTDEKFITVDLSGAITVSEMEIQLYNEMESKGMVDNG